MCIQSIGSEPWGGAVANTVTLTGVRLGGRAWIVLPLAVVESLPQVRVAIF